MTAYLIMFFLLLAGALLGGFGVFAYQFKKAKKDRMAYESARMELLDLQKDLRDMSVEQIRACSDHVREVYAMRQEDVTRYVKGTHAAYQLLNDLMGHFNSTLQVVPEVPQTAKAYIEKVRATADEIRILLNGISFENLAEVIAGMEASEAKALSNHVKLEQQQERLNEPS